MRNEYVMISPVYLAKLLLGENYELVLADEAMFYRRIPVLIKDYMEEHEDDFAHLDLPLKKMKSLSYEEIESHGEYELIDDIPLIIGIMARTNGHEYDPDKGFREANLRGAKTLVFKKDDFYRDWKEI